MTKLKKEYKTERFKHFIEDFNIFIKQFCRMV